MSFAAVNSERRARYLPLAAVLLAAWLLRPVEGRLASPLAVPAPELAGRGGILGGMGGFRAVVAGAFWLRANLAWERQDAAATRALLELAVAADDRPLYFWLNGARMMAYDFPAWQAGDPPLAVRRRRQERDAGEALGFLERGRARHGRSPALLVEMANIRLRALGDREGAARLFREAALLPGAPHYAARIHAELLRGLGRPAEALTWLRQVLPGLPADEPAAQRAVVEARIAELQAELAARR